MLCRARAACYGVARSAGSSRDGSLQTRLPHPTLTRSAKAAGEPPGDNPDLSYTMAFVTAIGGVSAYMTKKSSVGVSGQF